ncbi:dihydroorotate dehydrogenase electron transfer subunit [Clostridium amazonitimonense]|uniref:dihydroorotate dehydrogenase electron transfer subunit n=1 Tax=Clostridium amazonitimonense TaxID=1499689 RepID=UPI000509B401|nr:dihydroorotate dehydrogenase electron transfer subunit [Clostridium amazonitimonense]
MKPEYNKVKVIENVNIVSNIYKMSIVNTSSKSMKPGQFYMLKSWYNAPLLPRPISVSSFNKDEITFLYAVCGQGTELLSKLEPLEEIEVTGPLGNGFDIEKINGKVAIVSGGIGIAPMVQLVKDLKDCTIDLYAGFRNDIYAVDEMKEYLNEIYISTEDGSLGHKGYITDLLDVDKYSAVLCCGPEVMMKKVVSLCKEKNIPAYISMEKRMACGVGACLVCTCKTKDGNKRTCKDGPVFYGNDLIL